MKRHLYQAVASVLLVVAFGLARSAHAADFSFSPTLTVNEEYTDNIAEDKQRTLGSEFITRAMPSVALHYGTSFWVWDLAYRFEYRYYAQNKKKNEELHNGSAKTRLTLVDEMFFLDASDEYSRVSLDQSRDTTKESLFLNQSDQNIVTVSPNMVLRPTSKLILRPMASYQNIWYRDPAGVGRNVYSAGLGIDYQLTEKLTLISNYQYTLTDAENNLSRAHNLLSGVKYEFFKKSFIAVQGGYSWIKTGQRYSSNPLWDISANYAGDIYNIRANAGQKYANDPTSNRITLNSNYEIGLDLTFDRASLSFTSAIVKVENIPENTIFSISYNNSASLRYQVYSKWEASLLYSFNYIDIRHSNTFTKVSAFTPGISYSYNDTTKISLNYKNTHMYSPTIAVDNKDINSIILEVAVAF